MRRYLIIKPSSLGDVIHTLFVPSLIKRVDPNSYIGWIINDSLQSLLTLFPEINETIPFYRQKWLTWKGSFEFFSFLKYLRKTHWDIIIDFQGLLRSAWCAWIAKKKNGTCWGFKHAREGAPLFYDYQVEVPPHLSHAVDKNLFLINEVLNTDFPYPPLRFQLPEEAIKTASVLIDQSSLPRIAIAPGSRWTSKNWPFHRFVQLMEELGSQLPNSSFLLIGTPQEKKLGVSIYQCLTPEIRNRTLNLIGCTPFLPILVALFQQVQLLITNDSGPMHLASLNNLPTIAFFGPTDPSLTGPYHSNARVFRSHALCSPCFQRECPLPRSICWDSITQEEIVQCCVQLLQLNSNNSRTCS